MKFIVTRLVHTRTELDVSVQDPWSALRVAIADRNKKTGWRRIIHDDDLSYLDPDDPIAQAVALANKTVRCSGCDGSDFLKKGSVWLCGYCGLTG